MHCYNLFCSHLIFIQWLQNHLIPCPFKKFTGYDCPGCGFQRSVIALLKGHMHDSLQLYPATIPLLVTFVFVLLDGRLKFDKKHIAKKTLYLITGNIILIAYLYKLYNL
ncbi:DUF2752 domain-containing protein [Mucilaginibacter rubeus]|uniref:DUF2752 domain-containing protein n=1 Tax=Mucilaginibacter rubeus TaxID=2027860 RepID=A0AAE6ML74_9SPHI|nr:MULTISPECIES: DUF2752 domain-containing protein [Mucilaginibacter]QEM07476.1 DUF2752 domain-containing protein [Mucilaginibacter rubeus]QEM19929.1 DUF2752 domain-containing protein [Mucilaginibacter gossypii]QTE43363.1 DUF2752 domain-containing protein [Mucilaginibacter rubeus]QTE49963.1 DUF2752 domain-containing protein [Mucilaginibacter rubeus]QTE55054.1 DUF2752 domain-containing protein [Mucilaginibacter rubeus]